MYSPSSVTASSRQMAFSSFGTSRMSEVTESSAPLSVCGRGMTSFAPQPSFIFLSFSVFSPGSPLGPFSCSSTSIALRVSHTSSCPSPAIVRNCVCAGWASFGLRANLLRSPASSVGGSQTRSVIVRLWPWSTAESILICAWMVLAPPSLDSAESVRAFSSLCALRASARSHMHTWPEARPPTMMLGCDGQKRKQKTSHGASSTNCGWMGSAKLHSSTKPVCTLPLSSSRSPKRARCELAVAMVPLTPGCQSR
mmetsp:Transcript_78922/g.190821  ORF Transcript_78922/g.190821 Transcript_78922/m.190821 type:complete len:253 (+) Transcript_78922:953-1711(+)